MKSAGRKVECVRMRGGLEAGSSVGPRRLRARAHAGAPSASGSAGWPSSQAPHGASIPSAKFRRASGHYPPRVLTPFDHSRESTVVIYMCILT